MANLESRANGSVRIKVFNGRDTNGKIKWESMTWNPDPAKGKKENERDLQMTAAKFEADVKAGRAITGKKKLTLEEFAPLFLRDHCEHSLKPKTVDQYTYLLNEHILPEVGHIRLDLVTPQQLNRLYDKLLHKQKKSGTGCLSYETVKRCRAVLASLYATAIKWKYTTSDPTEESELPRKAFQAEEEEQQEYFTDEQTELFLDILDRPMKCPRKAHTRTNKDGTTYFVPGYTQSQPVSPQLKLLFYMALFLGMRRGELIALQWADINFDTGEISITKETAQVHGKPVTDTPKSKESIRIVTAPDIILAMLKDWQKAQLEIMLQVGSKWKGYRKAEERDRNFIFIKVDGSQMFPDTPTKALRKIITRYNESREPGEPALPIIKLHGLRHTHSTLLLSHGTDIKTVSARLGHANVSTTLRIYSHRLMSKDREAADTLEDIIIKKRKHS